LSVRLRQWLLWRRVVVVVPDGAATIRIASQGIRRRASLLLIPRLLARRMAVGRLAIVGRQPRLLEWLLQLVHQLASAVSEGIGGPADLAVDPLDALLDFRLRGGLQLAAKLLD
jgi:hypothetical protein